MLPISKELTAILDIMAAFSYNNLIVVRSMWQLMKEHNITKEQILELTDYIERHPQDMNIARMPITGNVRNIVRCPDCEAPLVFRRLVDNSKGYNANFACGMPLCDFDYYTVRSVEEVINEGIGDYNPPSTVEGLTAE